MEHFWAAALDWANDSRIIVILGLIALDLVLGVAAALKRKEFDWRKLGDFYLTTVAPKLIGYIALHIVIGTIAGVDSYIAAGEEGFLEPYRSPEAELIPDEYKSPEGYWTGLSLVAVDLIVNTDVLKEKNLPLPKTWLDLGKPEYKDELMMSNPTISGTNYAVIFHLIRLFGEEAGWDLLRKMHENIPFYTKRGAAPPNKAAMGEVAIGIDPYDVGVQIVAQGYPVVSIFPEEGVPGFLAPIALMKGAKDMEAAKAFIDWCLSKRGQEVQMAYTAKVGTRPDAEVPEYLQGLKNAKIVVADPVKVGEMRTSILDRWQQEFGSKAEQ